MHRLRRHATFVPADPPRDSQLAFWHTVGAPLSDEQDTSLDLVLPAEDTGDGAEPSAAGTVRVQPVAVELVPIASAIDALVALGIDDREASPSARAWGVVARSALDLLARGHLEPSLTPAGNDCWNFSPLSASDRAVRDELAQWLPPAAHCLAGSTGASPSAPSGSGDAGPTMMDPAAAVDQFRLAVADSLVRTAGAPRILRDDAWAGASPVDVGSLRPYLRAVDETLRCVVRLRLSARPSLDPRAEPQFLVELQVRSGEDPDVVVPAAELWAGHAPLPPQAEADVLLALRRGAERWPPLQRMLQRSAPVSIELTLDEALDLFHAVASPTDTASMLSAIGIELVVPTDMVQRPRAIAHVKEPETPFPASEGGSRFDLTSLCELTWRATLDGEPLTDDELSELADATRPLVRMRGEWVLVDAELADKLRRRTALPAGAALTAALSGTLMLDSGEPAVPVHLDGPILRLAERLRDVTTPHDLDPPSSVTATLRPYQRRGLAWLAEMADLGLGGVLADDMGLGKTVQLIALQQLRARSTDRPTLVVCPASLVSNWQREIERFAPSATVRRYHGSARHLDALAPGEIVLSTYGVVRRDAVELATVDWDLVVADEAQQIKNPSSSTARAMRRIPAMARFALTGTPVENRLGDLWSLLDWTTPGLLGPAEDFRRTISIPVERDGDQDTAGHFARLIAPFLLRRRKDDPSIVPELPPKTETDHPVPLTEEQASLYRANVEQILFLIATAEGMQRRGLVLKLITALKQICNHPAHFLGQDGPLPGRSGKLDAFSDLVAAITDAGDSTLVFTQYVQMGELLVAHLDSLGIASRFLHGSTSLRARAEMVDEFQRGDFPVLVLSLRAGGTGLNLTAATHVVHYDRWWNPAVEDQASDRAWRIGQDRPVQVHRLVSEGTIEDRIAEVLNDKRRLAESITGGEAWITEMSDDELADLVRLGGAPEGLT